jgi:undecaprenyl-diphosphatase
MMAAGGLKIFKALHHPVPGAPHENWGMVILGSVVAAVVSFVAVKWLLRYVQSHTFIAFGWYRIAVAVLIGVILVMGGKPSHQKVQPAPGASAPHQTVAQPAHA